MTADRTTSTGLLLSIFIPHADRAAPLMSASWLTALLARRPTKVAAIALANKLARMAWAMMARGEYYKEPAALAA
jgi:transposase